MSPSQETADFEYPDTNDTIDVAHELRHLSSGLGLSTDDLTGLMEYQGDVLPSLEIGGQGLEQYAASLGIISSYDGDSRGKNEHRPTLFYSEELPDEVLQWMNGTMPFSLNGVPFRIGEDNLGISLEPGSIFPNLEPESPHEIEAREVEERYVTSDIGDQIERNWASRWRWWEQLEPHAVNNDLPGQGLESAINGKHSSNSRQRPTYVHQPVYQPIGNLPNPANVEDAKKIQLQPPQLVVHTPIMGSYGT